MDSFILPSPHTSNISFLTTPPLSRKPSTPTTHRRFLTLRATTSNEDSTASPPSPPPPPPPSPGSLNIRYRSKKEARRQQLQEGAPRPPPPKKKWEEMTMGEKAAELYVGEKGLLFWLNKFAYASIFIIIGGWILFRFVGPNIGLYQLDAPPLSPASVFKGSGPP